MIYKTNHTRVEESIITIYKKNYSDTQKDVERWFNLGFLELEKAFSEQRASLIGRKEIK